MIILDIETSGINWLKCGLWQIGAIDLESGETFFEESRIDDEDIILDDPLSPKPVLEVIGKTEEELRDKEKQSQKQLLENFLRWVSARKIKHFVCQNPQFDMGYIWTKARKYGLEINFDYKAFDLHSIAQIKYFDINKQFFIEDNKSKMSLKRILEFCGIEDKRGVHNALEDVKLTAECFNRLVYGKNLLSEFTKFDTPNYLK